MSHLIRTSDKLTFKESPTKSSMTTPGRVIFFAIMFSFIALFVNPVKNWIVDWYYEVETEQSSTPVSRSEPYVVYLNEDITIPVIPNEIIKVDITSLNNGRLFTIYPKGCILMKSDTKNEWRKDCGTGLQAFNRVQNYFLLKTNSGNSVDVFIDIN